MKKSVTRIGAAILGLVILFGTMTAMASQLYPDLAPNHWCYKKIMEFVDKGYIDGYEDGTMRPNQTITRAEYVKVVNNFFGFKDGKTDKKFSDISDDAWYAKYVYAAVAQGYISGYEDNTFRPSNPITRQEATVILSRILKIDKEVYPKDHVDGLAQYSDGNEVADWAYTAIHSYSVYNFINGYEDGTLKILQNVTRAETVELLHVLEQKIEIDRPYGRTKTTKMPTINIIVEVGKNEFKPATTVNGWFNNENSCKNDDIDGVYVNITTTTDGATIYEKVNPRDPADRNYVTTTGNDFKNMFFLTDGVYDVSAYAKKTGRKTSGTNKVTLKIDTMAPCVEAKVLDNETNPKSNVAHTQKISVTLKDVIPSGLTEDKVSGVNEASAKYTWFIESGEDGFVRVGEWTSLSNGQVVETPTKYGKYKLAVSVKDNAGNSFGDEFDGEIRYDFVEDGETTPSEDIVVEVGNNAPQAEDLVLSTKLGIVASGDIVAFDSDGGDKLTYTIETKPISGEATVDAVTGRVTYTPSEKGTFTFTVKVSDGNESGDTIATVTVAVEDLNYTVNYYLKGTTNKLATSKFVDNQFFSTKILAVNEAIAIDGYNYDSADKEELIIGLNENVINLYYAKRTDLSYTVKYLEKETNNVLEDAKVVENQTFGDKITETAIEIDGYNKVAPTSGEVEITTGTNEITFYYEKRTDLSYTVKYLEKETNNVLEDAKVVENQTFGDKITETAIEIDGYNKIAPTSVEVEITTGTNEITFYYEKRTDLSYTVKYLEKETNKVLAPAKVVENKTFGDKITETAIEIDGYNKIAPTSVEVEITTGTNEITFYYEKRTDLSYTVKYLEKETNKVLAPAKVVENKTFGDKITETAIEIDGYNKIAPTSVEVEITTGTNEITFYYEKRTDLSYTVKYLEKETNKVLAPAKVVENKTFGDKITETAIEIDGYNKIAPTSVEVEITTGKNEITFYYEKRTDLSYIVNYYLEGTTSKVATSKTENGKTFEEEVTENAIDIAGYTKVEPTTKTIKISADESKNVINFYYTKRADLSYTVNYYLENTTTKVATSKTENGKTFEEEVTENAIDIAGYTKVEPTTKTIKISADESKNVINFYYTKRTDLSYTVNYYLEGTTTKVATSKTVNDKTFEEEVTENAIDVAGYTKVAPTTKTITISTDESKNVINFYYTKRTDLSYTVNYYLEGTTTKVATSKTVNGKTFEEEVTENAIDVAGYTKVAPTTKTITISTDESKNVINFYYTKRTDLSYTVNYYLEGTTTKVATSKTVNGKTFEEEVTENAIDVAGYTKVAPTTKTITISADESKNVINFYYTKRADLSYTVNYYLENTTTKVATSKTENGKTFEEEVTENAIDIAGYTKVEPTTKTIKISADESKNVINFYYTKRTDLSYTVNYYLEGTTTKVATSKTVNDKTFEEEVTENAIDVAGYTKVAPTTKTITISADESKNVINFYYKKNEGKLIANIKCNYPTKDGVKAEPGDTLKYKITLEEDGEAVSYPKTISIKLDADVEKPTNLPSNASYDETTHTITWTVSSKDDKLTYNVKVKKETPAGSKADTIITGATANGATSVDIEATVAVKVDKNKNVVLVLDVSGSMDACVKHDKFFERKFMSSKIGHYYGLSFEECSEKSRLEVMQEAAKNFTKSIIDERNTEDITITIVTFGDSAVNKGTLKNPTAAQVNAVINKLSANGGTNMRGAIKGATQVLNSSKMLENAVDYVVVLSDGDPEANQYYCDTATLNAFYATKANAYAIGFGNNYKKDELLKIVNNDSSKLFDAADADKLEDAFRKIGSEINKAQTAEGKIDVNVTGIKLYPIKLTYKNKDSETVNVTVKDSSELTSNNLSIVDGKLVWDISKYPGCTGFHVEVNRTKTIATLMLLAEEYGLEDVILVYGDPTITDKLPEEIEDVSGEDEEIIDDTVIGPKQPVSGDTETKILEETSGDTEIKPGKELSGDAEIQPTDETSGDPEKTEVDAKTSGDVEEKTEEVVSGDVETKATEKVSGDSENKTEEKSDNKDVKPTQETSGDVAKEETKQQEKKTEEPKAEETEQIEEPKSEETKQQEEKKSEKIIEKEEETKATVEEVVVPEIKDPLENEEKDEKAA